MSNGGQPILQLLKSYSFCSVQDMGRYGYRHIGVPVSGPMDRQSALLSQQRAGNSPDTTVLELIGPGTSFQVLEDVTLYLAGASAELSIDNHPIPMSSIVSAQAGQRLHIRRFRTGHILYVSVKGGFSCPLVLGSASPLPADMSVRLQSGHVLHGRAGQTTLHVTSHISPPVIDYSMPVRAEEGPEFNRIPVPQRAAFLQQAFRISRHSDRMALRVTSSVPQTHHYQQLPTSAVMPGIVQWLPGGDLLVLMRDCQTTGGYPRILVLPETSITQIVQRPPDASLTFSVPSAKDSICLSSFGE